MGIVAASQLSAFNDCCDWDWCECPGEWGVYAEALYWRPTHCPVPYARNVVTDQPTKEYLVGGDYEWGFRVGVGYTNDCFLADLSYLRLRPTDTAKASPVSTIQGGESATSAETSLKTRYQNVDFRFGQYLMRRPGCDFYVYGNVRWVDIELDNRTKALNNDHRHFQNSKFDGAGLGVGLGSHFEICGGFGVAGRFGFMGIIGDSELKEQREIGTSDASLKQPKRTMIVPGAEFRLGLTYAYECGCWNIMGEVGYELNYYINPLRFSTTDETNNDLPLVTCENVGFGGLYLRLGVGF